MKFFSLDHLWVIALAALLGSIWYGSMRPIDWVLLYGVVLANVRAQKMEYKDEPLTTDC